MKTERAHKREKKEQFIAKLFPFIKFKFENNKKKTKSK